MYQAKNFDHLLGTPGFSETLLKNHFTLYQGYVANTNKLMEELSLTGKEGKFSEPAYAEMKRRFGWEFNGMRLHELYFGGLVKKGVPINETPRVSQELTDHFGGYENWEKEFKATASMRGIGWAVLYADQNGHMFNSWINEHDVGHLAGCNPLLILDVFEHAYMTDYGIKRADYIEAFFKSIDWMAVEKRL